MAGVARDAAKTPIVLCFANNTVTVNSMARCAALLDMMWVALWNHRRTRPTLVSSTAHIALTGDPATELFFEAADVWFAGWKITVTAHVQPLPRNGERIR
jgi:hypothetical protein